MGRTAGGSVNLREREAWALACNSPAWACAGKDQFTDKPTAQLVLGRMLRSRRKKFEGQLSVYRCPYCHQFHIGNGQ